MRQLGMATVFPLDNNIYLHKVVGYMIFIQAWIHTIMHLCNFGEKSTRPTKCVHSAKANFKLLPLASKNQESS